jgi:uncharacterized membrane protein YfcA
MNESFWFYPILFITGLSAGLVDSIAGGGGLITLPVLLGLGFPPQVALGTNKFQASFGSFTASYHYVRNNVVSIHDAVPGILFTLLGAALGTWVIQQIDDHILASVIPLALLAIAVYTFFTPSLGQADSRQKISRMIFYILAGVGLGFYDGFFGPGVGSFWAIAFVAGLGFNLTRATGYTKVMNFTSNVVSFVVFLAGGFVMFIPGAVMAAGQILGARIGAGLVIRNGARFIRPVFITIVILTTLKLLYNRL